MSIFKKGDKVFDYAFGWGEVVKIENADYTGFLVIDVKFEGEVASYTIDGALGVDQHPTLSFTEYTLEGFSQVRPKEPLPFKKGDVCYFNDNGSNYWNTSFLRKVSNSCFISEIGLPYNQLALENPLLFPDTKIYSKDDL
jgi:hypothetical protein